MGGDGNDTIEAASLRDLSYTTIFDGSAARNQTIIVGGAGIDQLVIASDLADVSAFRDSDGGIYLRDGSTDVPVVVHEVEQFVFDDQTVLIEDLDVSVPVIGTTGDDTLDGTRNGSEAAMVTILSVPAVALIPSTGATARIPSVSPMPPANLLPSPAK